jgi:FkbM family methyltransferase
MNLIDIISTHFPNIFSENLTLIQIGANDGLQSDPFREAIIKNKIKSYLLEPIPDFYNMLKNNYLSYEWVNCFNLAITTENGEQEITYVPKINGLPEWTQGLGTFDSNKNFLGEGKGGHNLNTDFSNTDLYKKVKENIKKIMVKTNTLETFLTDQGIQKLDFYLSDTEGYDWVIFNQLDLNKYKPKVIYMETHTLGEYENNMIDEKLIKNGYTILDKTWDTIAIKK